MTWPTVKLSEVCEVVMGQAPSGDTYNEEKNGYPLIAGAGDFKKGRINVGKYTTQPTKISKVQDIVISIRASIGDKVWVDGEYCLGRGVAAIRANNKINRKYLWHVLSYVENNLIAKGRGATFLQVSKDDIQSLTIPLPPLAEQQRIAAILDKADEIKRKREQAIAKLDELAQSTFVEMFGDRKANPRRLTVKRLNEITAISSGSTPSRSTNGYMNGTIPWVKTAEVDGVEIYDTEEKLTEDGLNSIGNKLNQIDSIVVAMYGQGKTRGRVGLLKTVAATNQACGVIKPHKSFLPNFMFWQLHLAYSDLRALGRGGNQENLNLQLLGNFEVLLPPISEQEKYSNFVSQLQLHRKRMLIFSDKTSSLSSSLQHQAFTTGFRA